MRKAMTMSNNVSEWCSDQALREYPEEPVTTPFHNTCDEFFRHVIRGGSHAFPSIYSRVADREMHKGTFGSTECGFRIVRDHWE